MCWSYLEEWRKGSRAGIRVSTHEPFRETDSQVRGCFNISAGSDDRPEDCLDTESLVESSQAISKDEAIK